MCGKWKALTQHAWRTASQACTLKACLSSVPQNKIECVHHCFLCNSIRRRSTRRPPQQLVDEQKYPPLFKTVSTFGWWLVLISHPREYKKDTIHLWGAAVFQSLALFFQSQQKISCWGLLDQHQPLPRKSPESRARGNCTECLSLLWNSCWGQIMFVFPLI